MQTLGITTLSVATEETGGGEWAELKESSIEESGSRTTADFVLGVLCQSSIFQPQNYQTMSNVFLR